MKHPFFHKAVIQAYEKILPPESIPAYFLYFDIDPESIDINIHPTKTEIKFENESAIWQIIHASVREALGKFNMVPSIDFDQAGSIEIPIAPKSGEFVAPPEIQINPTYNPFETGKKQSFGSENYSSSRQDQVRHWEKLYQDFQKNRENKDVTIVPEKEDEDEDDGTIAPSELFAGKTCFQFKNKYILTPVKSGLMVIDQRRAHERILYENFMTILGNNVMASQQQLFPQTFDLNAADAELMRSVLDDLKSLGFDVREFGNNSFIINGIPGMLNYSSPLEVIEGLLEDLKSTATDFKEKAREKIAASLARASAIPYGYAMKPEEISQMIDQLFGCSTPNFSPAGKQVLTIIPVEQFEKMLK
jgi:DNA mismatch repair protein MutL